MSLTWTRSVVERGQTRERLGLHLFCIADDVIDLGHFGESFGLDLGRATGDDEARSRIFAAELADGLAGLADGFAGDSAGVDDDGLVEACGDRMRAHDLAFIGIEAATQGDDTGAG